MIGGFTVLDSGVDMIRDVWQNTSGLTDFKAGPIVRFSKEGESGLIQIDSLPQVKYEFSGEQNEPHPFMQTLEDTFGPEPSQIFVNFVIADTIYAAIKLGLIIYRMPYDCDNRLDDFLESRTLTLGEWDRASTGKGAYDLTMDIAVDRFSSTITGACVRGFRRGFKVFVRAAKDVSPQVRVLCAQFQLIYSGVMIFMGAALLSYYARDLRKETGEGPTLESALSHIRGLLKQKKFSRFHQSRLIHNVEERLVELKYLKQFKIAIDDDANAEGLEQSFGKFKRSIPLIRAYLDGSEAEKNRIKSYFENLLSEDNVQAAIKAELRHVTVLNVVMDSIFGLFKKIVLDNLSDIDPIRLLTATLLLYLAVAFTTQYTIPVLVVLLLVFEHIPQYQRVKCEIWAQVQNIYLYLTQNNGYEIVDAVMGVESHVYAERGAVDAAIYDTVKERPSSAFRDELHKPLNGGAGLDKKAGISPLDRVKHALFGAAAA